MREIKFRAWDKENKIMSNGVSLEWFLSDHEDADYDMEFPKTNESLPLNDFLFFRDHYDLMQYTGLKDKSGNEIYEGDIVVTKYQPKAKVVWDSENACFAMETVDEIVNGELMYLLRDIIEIIGNIYENPELLNSDLLVQERDARMMNKE